MALSFLAQSPQIGVLKRFAILTYLILFNLQGCIGRYNPNKNPYRKKLRLRALPRKLAFEKNRDLMIIEESVSGTAQYLLGRISLARVEQNGPPGADLLAVVVWGAGAKDCS
jgi:hypothetical protein